MSTQPNILKASLLLAAIAILTVLASCQPAGLVFDPQSGRWVSPLPTPASPTSPLPTPIVTSGPTPMPPRTPWPPDFTPSPTLTPSPTPEGIPAIIYDPLNRFSITLLPGWYAYTPDAKAIVGVTTISNYDKRLVDEPPPGSVRIQISIGELKPEQSFEQWLTDWRVIETSPEYGAFGVTLTEPQPFTLGRYQGVSFIGNALNSASVLEIDLVTSDKRVAVIGVSPADSPLLSEVLSMLSTIDISPKSLP
ncbi:MAG TPA: hypothetical protein VFL17_05430 [Anaerolineae bacterium]|nr:hypothetical protein [Anaerolineae bacterium]